MTLHRITKASRPGRARIITSAGLLAAGSTLGISHAAAAPGVVDGGTLLAALLLAASLYAAAPKGEGR